MALFAGCKFLDRRLRGKVKYRDLEKLPIRVGDGQITDRLHRLIQMLIGKCYSISSLSS